MKGLITSFPKNFWVVIIMEFFERGSYYGMMSVLALYLSSPERGGVLGFSEKAIGLVMGIITPLLYLLPIFSGATAEKIGYKKMLIIAFSFLSIGYFLTGMMTSYYAVFLSLIIMALGAGMFKPIPSGTIARITTQENSSLGFGIFYWSINLGAFIFPLFLVNFLKTINWFYVFALSGSATALMLLVVIFLYKEPPKPENTKNIKEILVGIITVLKDYKFILMICIYSGFWILYFQMFHTVLWYLKDFVDMSPVQDFVNHIFSTLKISYKFVFDVEHVTVLNAGTIITLQLIVSKIVNKMPALPTMIGGILLGTIGMACLAISNYSWTFITGIIIFSIGEMTTHPKFISYIGLIAPKDKVALYMGYAFLYGVIGSSVGGLLGGYGYDYFIKHRGEPQTLWILFSCIGLATIIGLLLFNKFIAKK
ncbi:MAG: MFS transporter [Deltaproteobacteria bacterium]|nr:MFS transporter [Deltaproteobacteria bacterium]